MQKKFIMQAKLAAIGMAVSTVVSSTFCTDLNVNTTAQKVIDFIFGAIQLGGVAMIAMGVIQIGKAVTEGESAPPNAVSKALGFIVAGIVMCAIKSVLQALGVPVTGFKLV